MSTAMYRQCSNGEDILMASAPEDVIVETQKTSQVIKIQPMFTFSSLGTWSGLMSLLGGGTSMHVQLVIDAPEIS